MSVNFYDVNFNQQTDAGGLSSIPAISGYIIDDYAYDHRVENEGKVTQDHIVSQPSATSNIQGAISMDRYRFDAVDPQDNPISFVSCRLQPDGEYVIRADYQSNVINVEIWHKTVPPMNHATDTVSLVYLESDLTKLYAKIKILCKMKMMN